MRILLIWTVRQLRVEWQQTVAAQQTSEKAHNLIQSILDNASDAHVILNEEGTVKGRNPKAETVFGWSAKEAMERRLADLCQAPAHLKKAAGKDLGAVLAVGIRRMKAERTFGLTAAEAIGQPLRDLAIAWDWSAVNEAIAQVAQCREAVHLNKVRVTRPGERTRFLKLALSPLPKDEGLDLVLMGEDITEYLALEHDLSQAQKLESLGELAARVAHEINTPTQFVGDNMRFLSEAFTDLQAVLERHAALLTAAKAGDPTTDVITQCEAEACRADLEYLADEVPKAIAQSLDRVKRIAKIVRAMKEFAHPGGEEVAYEDLNKAIKTTVEVSRNEWKYVADVTTELTSDLPLVCCQLGLNIIVNAAHAIGDLVKGTNQKGQIAIATRPVGDGVEIQITDRGAGFPTRSGRRSSIRSLPRSWRGRERGWDWPLPARWWTSMGARLRWTARWGRGRCFGFGSRSSRLRRRPWSRPPEAGRASFVKPPSDETSCPESEILGTIPKVISWLPSAVGSAPRPLAATLSASAGRDPYGIPSWTQSVPAFLPGSGSMSPRSFGHIAQGRQHSTRPRDICHGLQPYDLCVLLSASCPFA